MLVTALCPVHGLCQIIKRLLRVIGPAIRSHWDSNGTTQKNKRG
jgi:hypothetical protein